ncbi:MAG: enoyl-CoA hydratase/isomerase family protein [Actinomycetota bacterium]
MTSTPTFATLDITVDDRVATLEFARPQNLNALSRQCLSEVITASTWLGQQSQIRVVIVRGQGRAFCSGFDLGDFAQADPNMSPRESGDLGRLATEALTNVPQITIAAIHGHCVGGGVVLAAACDLRIASDDARFSIPEVDLGIPLAWGGIPRLVREIGPAATKELVLTCRPFDADEAKQLRFVNTVVPRVDLDAHVRNLANSLAIKSSLVLRMIKAQVNAVTEEMIGTMHSISDTDSLVVATHDHESRTAGAAYIESRKHR